MLIECNNLTYKKGSRIILNEIDWKINENERWVVLGHNGCGKTTLVSILAGYREWTSGTVNLFGEELNEESTIRLRKKIGFVSSSYFDNCLLHENGLNIVLGGFSGQIADGLDIADNDVLKAKKILSSLGLKYKYMYPYDLLSRGQQQKILLARAFLHKPELLILDEPCSGLDMISRDYILNTLQEIAACTQCSMIYVTHHSDEILPFFTHALLLKDKKIHSKGKINEIITEENMSDFFGVPTEVFNKDNHVLFKIKNTVYMDKKLWG